MISLSEVPSVRKAKAKYWFSVFADWEKSKLKKSRYCTLHHINPSSFYYWLRYLQGVSKSPYATTKTQTVQPLTKPEQKKAAPFIALELAPEPTQVSYHTGLSILLGGGKELRIERGFDPSSLAQVLKVLEGVCLLKNH